MNLRVYLCAMLLATSAMSYAGGGVYTTVSKLEGHAIVGQETIFKIDYKWLTDQKRSGKVFYNIVGTACKGEVAIDQHSGLLPVSGTLEIKCTLAKSAVFRSDTVLQLYDGSIKKERTMHQRGKVTVTNE